jgi:hypothetical protein
MEADQETSRKPIFPGFRAATMRFLLDSFDFQSEN